MTSQFLIFDVTRYYKRVFGEFFLENGTTVEKHSVGTVHQLSSIALDGYFSWHFVHILSAVTKTRCLVPMV